MSNLDLRPEPAVCGGTGFVVAEPVRELLSPRRVRLGESTEVRRLLPNLGRRMVGAWCFVDHYGPDDIADESGMSVPPHPHMGLQTVSWLHEGEVLHRDSLGSEQIIRPRELGLMTSGRAISHAEQSPRSHARFLHGAQLWVALPDGDRHTEPRFEHHPDLPVVTAPGLTATVILGELDAPRRSRRKQRQGVARCEGTKAGRARAEDATFMKDAQFIVLRNAEHQYSLWPIFIDIPQGWDMVFGEASRPECIEYIERTWTDMRPKSLADAMDGS